MAKLYFYYAAMNAGKTTALLQSSYNYQERGMATLLYTLAIDTRYGVGKIASRIGIQAEAIPITSTFDFLQDVQQRHAMKPVQCVLVDEAHFITKEQVLQLTRIVDILNIPVLAYGLRSDFLGETFPGSQYLLAWADTLQELKTICFCGQKATMNARMDSEGKRVRQGEQVDIGGNEKYTALCRKHFELG